MAQAAKAGKPAGIKTRPLSPHLQIYANPINMVMSILHRITGVALYLGTLLLAAWLIAAASGPATYEIANSLFGAAPAGVPVGKLVLLGYTWALMHHMLGGVRHMIWDTGSGFELPTVRLLGWLTIIGSALLTLAVWAIAFKIRGGL
jgi:succinate dehydrogenase / fumarate reductase, cytochrome b subunit